jgi:signal transduction histidine kinase
MARLRLLIYASLVLAWCLFALWQVHDYRQQLELIEVSLRQQARSIMTAMVGGMRSHRRLGRFFQDQLQGMLDELVKSDDVVYAAICSPDSRPLVMAGDAASQSHGDDQVEAQDTYFRLSESFELTPAPPGQHGPTDAGRGAGRGPGKGPGRGLGPGGRRWEEQDAYEEGAFGSGGNFVAHLVLNRTRANELARRVTWSHLLAVLTAALVVLCIGLVWRATMNAAEARGRSRVFEAEARHLRELGQAAAGLAHETRNPLGLIRGWTQRLAESAERGSSGQTQSQAIIEECDRVTARINQFLAFARPCQPDLQAVDIGQLLEELASIMQPDLDSHQLVLHSEVEPGARTVLADYELLRQVLFNLLQNAVHFSPDQGTIDVTVCRQGARQTTVQVADRGPGVEPEAVDSLFTPYFTTRPQGTGLGLAIVRHIATLHGWEVTYRHRAGGGAVFEIGRLHVAT